jgi:hypothetical protein
LYANILRAKAGVNFLLGADITAPVDEDGR